MSGASGRASTRPHGTSILGSAALFPSRPCSELAPPRDGWRRSSSYSLRRRLGCAAARRRLGAPSYTVQTRGCSQVLLVAFLATGQHGAADLRIGPDGRLSGRLGVLHRRRSDRARNNSLRCAERHSHGPGRSRAATWSSTYALLWSLRGCIEEQGSQRAFHLSKPRSRLLSSAL
eukprot:scaffold19848_cov131-Isochrysis_galbana.AAC.6